MRAGFEVGADVRAEENGGCGVVVAEDAFGIVKDPLFSLERHAQRLTVMLGSKFKTGVRGFFFIFFFVLPTRHITRTRSHVREG